MNQCAQGSSSGGSSSSISSGYSSASASSSSNLILNATSCNINISGNNNSSSNSSSKIESNKRDKMWYFTAEQLSNSPSRRHGIDADQELFYRQMTAYLIQEMGQRLQVSQLCINTAIVYMHRFYAFHSFTHFHRNSIAVASLFLAAKVEEQPRRLEHVLKAANKCLPQTPETQTYAEQAQDLVFNENVLLQTLGFDVAIDHPHTHVVKTCHLVKACRDLAQTSYFLASNSLHLTSMCLQYRPTVVACFCIYLACKWSHWEIPPSTEGRHWFYYVDKSVSLELLKQLTDEFIGIYEKSPARLKSKLNSIKAIAQGASNRGGSNKDKSKDDWKMGDMMKGYHSSINTDSNSNGAYSSNSNDGSSSSQPNASTVPTATLLPPPSQPAPQQQMRKSDTHSSQHRAHHSSSNSSASRYSTSGTSDGHTDHKAKQQSGSSYGSNVLNRTTSNLQAIPSVPSSGSSQRGSLPQTASGRSSSSSSSSLSSQRPQQVHSMDYHKRERNGMGSLVPPMNSHKMPIKQEPGNSNNASGRSNTKDSLNRMSDTSGKQTTSNSKIYTPYSNQLPSASVSKVDDLSRSGILHNQRSNYLSSSSSSNTGSAPISTSGYHQHRPSGSNPSTNNSSKSSVHSLSHTPYDQQLPTPYSQSQQQQSQQPQPQQQQQHQSHMNISAGSSSNFGNIRGNAHELTTTGDDNATGTHLSLQQLMTQKNSGATSSLFIPELKDTKTQHFNGLTTHDNALNFKLSNRDKDSPKKERHASGTPTKKDKQRMSTSNPGFGTSHAVGFAQQAQQMKTNVPTKKPEHQVQAHEHTGTSGQISSGIGSGSLKRTCDGLSFIKTEDESYQRDKIRKLEGNSLSSFTYPSLESSNTNNPEKHTPLTVTNGMETTPDLVRSLLKDIYTPNTLIKAEPITMPGLKPPAELLDPSATNSVQASNTTAPFGSISSESTLSAHNTEGGNDTDKLDGNLKSEKKKKKKEKHKHKEKDKDKTKDREERKKHKKDKDKHKERGDREHGGEHLKLIIPKDKLEYGGSGGSGGDLKIKIGKGDNNSSLKIKIPKEVLNSYNSSYSSPKEQQKQQQQPTQHQQQPQQPTQHQQQQQQPTQNHQQQQIQQPNQQQHHSQQHNQQQQHQQIQQQQQQQNQQPLQLQPLQKQQQQPPQQQHVTISSIGAAFSNASTVTPSTAPSYNMNMRTISSMVGGTNTINSSNAGSISVGSGIGLNNAINKKRDREREREKDKKRPNQDVKIFNGAIGGTNMLPNAPAVSTAMPLLPQHIATGTAPTIIGTSSTATTIPMGMPLLYAKK